MTLRSTLRLGALLVWALVTCGPIAAQPRAAARAATATDMPVVYGLIVQLRDAPSHVELAREQALARAGGAATSASAGERESARWQRLLADLHGDAALRREVPALAQAARRDPVGSRAQVLRFAEPLTAAQAERVAARLAARPEVESVTPNTRERRQAFSGSPPSDPYYAGLTQQWWLQAVQGSNANAIEGRLRGVPGFLTAWTSTTTGSPAAVVAVLDTGITCHPDLGNMTPGCIGGAILPGYDFVTDSGYANDGDGRDADPRDPGDWVSATDRSADSGRYSGCDIEDSSWHGTILAGMVAAQTNNGIGGAAVNWDGRILPVRVAGKCGAEVADIVDGMRWAAGLPVCKTSDGAGGCSEFVPPAVIPARIINISFGGSAPCGEEYQKAIDELRAVGAVVVAAAGNGWGAPSRPASCQRVLGVGALNRDGFKATYSNFGVVLALSTVGGDDDDGAWGRALGANRMDDSGVLSIGNAGSMAPGASDYFNHFGTSFSTPVVSGAVSLMLSINPALTADQIISGLKASVRPHVTFPAGVTNLGLCSDANPGRCQCTKATCGAGILDVPQALAYARDPLVYVNTRSVGELIDTAELRAAAAVGPDRPANMPPPAPSSGGGAMNAVWLLALMSAAAALWLPFNARPSPRKARNPRPTRRR